MNGFLGIIRCMINTKFEFLTELFLDSNQIDSVEEIPRMFMPKIRKIGLCNSDIKQAKTKSAE